GTAPVLDSFLLTPPPPPQLYTLSLHDALPISCPEHAVVLDDVRRVHRAVMRVLCAGRSAATWMDRISAAECNSVRRTRRSARSRSEEHTSELQSRGHLVCRLRLEKKKL